MKFKKILLLIMVSVLFSACAPKEYVQHNSAFILFKTPTFKYADMGFIYANQEALKVEIYSSGKALMSLEVSDTAVCMSQLECMGKKRFNEELLSKYYPEDILENIFRGKPIFNKKGFKTEGNGFTQKIVKNGKYSIDYSVLNNHVIFHDTINFIDIKVKKQ